MHIICFALFCFDYSSMTWIHGIYFSIYFRVVALALEYGCLKWGVVTQASMCRSTWIWTTSEHKARTMSLVRGCFFSSDYIDSQNQIHLYFKQEADLFCAVSMMGRLNSSDKIWAFLASIVINFRLSAIKSLSSIHQSSTWVFLAHLIQLEWRSNKSWRRDYFSTFAGGVLIPIANSRIVPSQWETALLCNDVSHLQGASLDSGLQSYCWLPSSTKRPPRLLHLKSSHGLTCCKSIRHSM